MKEEAAFGGTLWSLVRHSDSMSYAVLIILAGMSVISWTIFFYRLLSSFRMRWQLSNLVRSVCAASDKQGVHAALGHVGGGTVRTFLTELLLWPPSGTGRLAVPSIDLIERAVDRALVEEEGLLPFLSTTAAVGPLLGLFGTVWGLVNAFIQIGREKSADIVAVAPGISQALITTLAGLLVAIPALAMYNLLIARVHRLELKMMIVGEQLAACVKRHA